MSAGVDHPSVMQTYTQPPETMYRLDQIVAAAAIVIGGVVGLVLFVAAPFVVTGLTVGAMVGFVAARVQYNWTHRVPTSPWRTPKPGR